MTIHDIENLSFAQLKANRKDLAASAATLPAADLAARYVQARADAKHRDERMAEMGVEFTRLTNERDALAKQVATLTADIELLKAELEKRK